tara:strand:- start:47943 stop:49469 length:1527 start_codon:yes stop_codon:yes gene_type:complete
LTILKGNYFISKLQSLWIVCIILCTQTILAQYTNIINSNRPGFSESPYSVGTGVYQLETKIFYRKTNIYPTFSRPKSEGIDFLFRTSFFLEKLEINLNFAVQKEQVSFQNIFNSNYYKTGFSKLTVGAKYLVYEQKYADKSKEIRSWVARNKFDWKRLIPSVAAYVGLNTGIPDDIYKASSFSPKAGVLLQNDITNNFNIITNIYYDRIGTELPEFSYIITATFSFNKRWSTFIENQTMLDKFEYQSNIGSGIAFLYNRNIQVNSSLRLLANAKYSGFYASIGASYRFDRHVDKDLRVDGNKKRITVTKKRFFGRLFSKVTNVFSKKGKKQYTRKSKLKKETIESINKNINNDENISGDNLEVKPLRIKPKRKRIKPTKRKPTKENTKNIKTKKGFLGIFKVSITTPSKDTLGATGVLMNDEEGLTKKQLQRLAIDKKSLDEFITINPKEDKDKGTKELEKEIKKLEKEVKKEDKRLKQERKKEEAKKRKREKKEKKKKEKNDKDDKN